MEGVIHPALAAVLRAGRADFNQRFKLALQQHRGLTAEDWLGYLQDTLSPVAEKLAAHDAECVAPVIHVLYDQGLPLVAQHWLGAQSRMPLLAELYRQLLGALTPALAHDPLRLSGSLLNALHQVCQHDARLARTWADALARLATNISDVDRVLALGVVLAWRSGLPAYRAAALQASAALPAELTQAALNLSAPPDAALWAALQQAPTSSTLTPEEIAHPPALEWLGWLGGYRGLGHSGALFTRRPQLGIAGGKLAASDGEYTWWLAGDGYGMQAVRMGSQTDWPLQTTSAASPVRVALDGTVTAGKQSRRFTELESADACVWHGGLLAVTLRTSYQVALLRMAVVQPA